MKEGTPRRKPEKPLKNLTFQEFDQKMRGQVTFVNQAEYDEIDTLGQDMIAWINAPIVASIDRFTLKGIEIFVNKDKFEGFPEKKDILMQVAVTHEIVEEWESLLLNRTQIISPGRGPAHNTALLHEFVFAFNHDCHEEYRMLTARWAKAMTGVQHRKFSEENMRAFNKVIFRGWRPDDNYATRSFSQILAARSK
jgi:hypothetical protein